MRVRATNVRNHRASSASRMWAATIILCLGLILTSMLISADTSNEIFSIAAVGAGLSLVAALTIEAQGGAQSLIRTDIVMLVALYGLTLLEFLFPQPSFFFLSPESALLGVDAVFLSIGAIAVGRHLVPTRGSVVHRAQLASELSFPMFRIFLAAFFLGYLHILLAVNFDLIEAIRQMTLPRFSQSWSRGRLGGWNALITELGLLINLLPPIAGAIYARSKEYSTTQKVVVTAILLLTLFHGFAGGTRNILVTYVITGFASYAMLDKRMNFWRMIRIGLPLMVLTGAALVYMLEFRKVGLTNYSQSESDLAQTQSVFIDNNIVNISRLTEAFPHIYDFLGLEVPYAALIRPIPRVFWPEKPEGLSVGIEQALGVDERTMTLSATFVGEAYMTGGLFAVALVGLVFGASAARWNRLGQSLYSPYRVLLYASGFLCAAISMRSLLVIGPAVLPPFALWLYARLFLGARA